MLHIDGSQGEGGGQILRSSLSLSVYTQQPFRISSIRGNRDKPGLRRQHLTAVKAAAAICGAEVIGATLDARELTFRPGKLAPGAYSFSIGTAGSTTLVLQTLLPPLLMASAPTTVRITGGTHNKGSPPFDFLSRAFLPLLERMGARVGLDLVRHGFYPRGGGEIRASVEPAALSPAAIHERGGETHHYAEAYVAALPLHIAQRELEVVGRALSWDAEQLILRPLANDMGPGNALTITTEFANVTEVFTGFGERGVRAETVAENAARDALHYVQSAAPVGKHLADQLLLPMAIAGGGSFTTTTITEHLRSNALVIETFTNRRIDVESVRNGYRVTCR